MKPTVLVTDNINQAAVSILQDVADVTYQAKTSAEELQACLKDYDGLMIRSASKVTPENFASAPRLKIVGRAGVGTDNIDLKAATEHGCIVVNSPDGNTVAAAEHTLGLLFALARHIPTGDQTLKAGQWERKALTGIELRGKTLGLIGLGKIGSRVATVCKAIGMSILVYDPYLAPKVIEELGAQQVDLPELYAQADFITVHVPKTKDTLNLLNKETLAQCKPGVRIVNCARGGIINEADLADAIRSGHVAGAAIDVFSSEPPDADNPLLQLGDKVVVTPHLGASTEEAQINVALDVAQQLRDFFREGTARSAVNLPLLRADLLEPVKAFMPLAETLGSFARQLIEGPVHRVEITAKGSLSEKNTAPLKLAVLKGLFTSSREGVNYVNAPLLAEERGVEVRETTSSSAGDYSNQLSIRLYSGETESVQVAGTLIGEHTARIVRVNQFDTLIEPEGVILVAPHTDRPGMVAQIAKIMGEASININAMQVGKNPDQPEQNVMILNLDKPVEQSQKAAILSIDGFTNLHVIKL